MKPINYETMPIENSKKELIKQLEYKERKETQGLSPPSLCSLVSGATQLSGDEFSSDGKKAALRGGDVSVQSPLLLQ